MSKYKIGIPAWKTGDNSFGVTVPYIRFIEYFGEPVILSPTSEINTNLDLILLPGGPDVDVDRYSATPDYYNGKACPFREHFDKMHLPEYINSGISIFGICRGMQSLGIIFNGSMDQHISHIANKQYDRGDLVHSIDIHGRFRQKLIENLSFHKQILEVNSIHHQAIKNTNLQVVATSRHKDEKGYNYIELIAHEEMPIVGVQWHPEEIYDEFTVKTINYLLETKKSILS